MSARRPSHFCLIVGLVTFTCPLWTPCTISAVDDLARIAAAEKFTPKGNLPPRNHRITYRFGWSGIEAARGQAALAVEPDGSSQINAEVSTSGLARTLWSLDASLESRCSPGGHPHSLRQIETYRGGRQKLTEITFESGRFLTWSWSRPDKQRPIKPKIVKRSGVHSVHSALLALQRNDWQDKPAVSLLVTPGKTIYLLEAKHTGTKPLEGAFGKVNALLLELSLGKIRKDGSIEPHTKVGRIRAWLSNDPYRTPLRVEANVFIGYVFAEALHLP